jgi:hypothetical protein
MIAQFCGTFVAILIIGGYVGWMTWLIFPSINRISKAVTKYIYGDRIILTDPGVSQETD